MSDARRRRGLRHPFSSEGLVHRPTRCFAAAVAAMALIAGCRSAGQRSSSMARPGSTLTTGRVSDVVESVELQTARVGDAHEALVRLRPEFLRPRGKLSRDPEGGAPIVYVNGIRQGGPEMLRSVPIAAIREIRYLSGQAAAARFGRYDRAGVIAVETWR